MRVSKCTKYVLICTIALMTLIFTPAASFADMVLTSDLSASGRIKFVSAGLIIITENRADFTFRREVKNDYFEDEITYKKYFFSKESTQILGRLENLNRLSATILTKNGKVEIQRYKIKNIVMKVPDKGY